MKIPPIVLPEHQRRVALAIVVLFHLIVICASNYLVQLPVDIFGFTTTWGAFSFPFIFVTTDLTVRLLGQRDARILIAWVMLPALVLSYLISVVFEGGQFQGIAALLAWNTFIGRIALASFSAYVLGQLLDIQVFARLRQLPVWWVAPTASTIVGTLLDTLAFFAVAFWHCSDPFMAEHWLEIALVDYAIKLIIGLVLFVPLYGALLSLLVRKVLPHTLSQQNEKRHV